jgi:hypothetical protein
MILVEGGPSSIKTICQALQETTPVLVIKVIPLRNDLCYYLTKSFYRTQVVQRILLLNYMNISLIMKMTINFIYCKLFSKKQTFHIRDPRDC